jgi:hypothetical protein
LTEIRTQLKKEIRAEVEQENNRKSEEYKYIWLYISPLLTLFI